MDRTQKMKADLEAYRASKQTTSPVANTSSTTPSTLPKGDINADLQAYRASKQTTTPTPQATTTPEKTGLEKVGGVLNDVFGGGKIGELIGTQIAKAGATEDEKQYITGPSAKEVIGDVGRVALNFAPVGKIATGLKAGGQALKLGKLAKPVAGLATGAGIGYAGDVTTKLASGEEQPFDAGAGTAIGTALGALPIVGKTLGKVSGLAGEIALGTKGKQALQTTIKNPSAVQSFAKGKTIQDVANTTAKAVQKYGDDSKKAFNKVIDMARDDVKFTPTKGVTEVKNVIKNTPLYLEPQEKLLLGKAKTLVGKWKNWTPKGIIKLRQELDRQGFYKDDDRFKASDKIITAMRRKLNEMAISLDSSIGPALEKATFDIEQGQKLGYSLVGNAKVNPEATANRLKALLTKIDDPLEKQATKELLDLLKTRTGVDVGSELSALNAYLEYQKPISSGSILSVAQGLGRRLSQGPAIGLGKATEAIKKLPIGKSGQFTPGDILFNKK